MALLPVLAKSRPAANPSPGRDTPIIRLHLNREMQIRVGTDQLVTTLLPALTCVRRDKSRPVDRIRRVGALTISKIATGYGTPTLSLGWNGN
jgi:hypothetical protein